jgi:transcriptional regulator with XRE-family HTH domain
MTAHAADDGPGVAGGQPGDAVPREHAVNPLQGLIQERLRERGWSYGEVARRGGLPRSTVYTLATTRNLVRPPRPATIDALARGLEVPVSAVRAAAAESTGLHYYDEAGGGQAGEEAEGARRRVVSDRERDLLIASIDELSPEDRQHVAALVESLRSRAARGRPAGLALAWPAAPLLRQVNRASPFDPHDHESSQCSGQHQSHMIMRIGPARDRVHATVTPHG